MSGIVCSSSLEALSNHGFDKVALAIGVFDGVHLGHQRVLDELSAMAERRGAKPVVLTFHPHPRTVLQPRKPLPLLTSPERKCELLEERGIEAVVRFPFSAEFAALSAETFLDDCLLAPDITLEGICVGKKWRFGAGGKGDVATIERYAEQHGFEFNPVDELILDGVVVSSTAIRRAIAGGRLDDAEKMLGRRHFVSGVVEEGDSIGGPVLGFPTANLAVVNEITPPPGVYAAIAHFDGSTKPAAVFVGDSPSFGKLKRRKADLEAHVLDFDGNLNGRGILVEFVDRIREARSFPSAERLREEMKRDVEKTREIISRT